MELPFWFMKTPLSWFHLYWNINYIFFVNIENQYDGWNFFKFIKLKIFAIDKDFIPSPLIKLLSFVTFIQMMVTKHVN